MRFHIDTDMGVDDGLALLLADRLLPKIAALSTVFGNVGVTTATRNALLFRDLLGRRNDWAVLEGAGRAMDGFTRDASHVHGADGMGGATEALDAALLARIAAEPIRPLADASSPAAGPVVLIGLGPATNIPALIAHYGAQSVERIVLMTGAFFDVGNITPQAEFNAHCDPHALQTTLDLGIPTTLVPLDLTRKIQLRSDAFVGLAASSTSVLGSLLSNAHASYMHFYRTTEGVDGCIPHDAVAVLAALEPEKFRGVEGKVFVDTVAEWRGATTIAFGSSHVSVLMGGRLKWVRQALGDLLVQPL